MLRSALLTSIERPARHTQITIEIAALACLTTRGFLPWRLSDAGPGACGIVAMGRHPKPFTEAEVELVGRLPRGAGRNWPQHRLRPSGCSVTCCGRPCRPIMRCPQCEICLVIGCSG